MTMFFICVPSSWRPDGRRVWGAPRSPVNTIRILFVFALGVEAAGIRHRYIRRRRAQQNGEVARVHRIDQEELGGRHRFQEFDACAAALRDWEVNPDETQHDANWRSMFPMGRRMDGLLSRTGSLSENLTKAGAAIGLCS